MKILTIIPARDKSKGMPQKNLRLFNGKLLLSHLIKTSLNCKFDLNIYISSKSENILKLATEIGVNLLKRNLFLSDDPGRVRSQIISVVCQIQLYAMTKSEF